MFNSGIRGKRAVDNQGVTNPQGKYIETKYPQPSISGYAITGIDDTQLDPAGGQTVLINGTGFAAGISAVLGGTQIGAVTLVSPTQISFTTPAKSAGSYSLVVYNSTGGAAILVPGLTYSSVPTYTTNAGTLGTLYETTAISTQVVATSDSSLTYSLSSGTLPSGATLNSDGTITGTSPVDSSSTTYTFAIKATDAELQDVTRTFTLTINTDVVSWSSPTNGASYELIGNQAMGNVTLSATSAAGYGVTYTANALPTGVTLSSGTISGTPTVAATTSTLLTATADTTGRTATRTVNWSVTLGDSYWKYTSMLLSGSTPTTTFINDASLNNSQLTVFGDTKPSNFNPYSEGYYSIQYNGTTNDYTSIPHNSGLSIMSGSTNTFVAECWVCWNVVSAFQVIMDKSGRNGVSFQNWAIELDGSKQIKLVWGASGTPGTSAIGQLATTTIPVPGVWYHIAFVKSSADWSVFVNGTRGVTFNGLNTANDGNPAALRIGLGIDGEYNGGYMNGYVSNVRVYNGPAASAPYSATSTTITVPTAPLTPVSTYTYAIANQSNRYIENSSISATVTRGSGVKISGGQPFTTTTGNTTVTSLGSAYFDGTSDYLTAPASVTSLLSGTWTVEAWCYMTVAPTGNTYATSFPILTSEDNAGTMYHYWGIGSTAFVGMTRAGTGYETITGTMPAANQWFHVAVTNVGTLVKVYINGVLAGSLTQTAGTWNATGIITRIGALYTYNYANGYISNLRVINGTELYTSNFLPQQSPLTSVTNTQLLTLQYNGGANNNGFVDQSSFNNIITRNGNATQGTFSPFSQNGWSNYFDGASTYYFASSINLNHEAGAFTYEGWVNLPTGTSNKQIFVSNILIGTGGYSGSTIGALRYYDGVSTFVGNASYLIATGTWNHFAIVREGTGANQLKLYVNGILVLVGTSTNNPGTATTNYVGSVNTSTDLLTGYISNFRFVKGTAVYTTASTTVGTQIFTPPASPLSAIAKTQLLICQSNRFIDSSPNNFTPTISATPSVQAYSPFGGVTSVPKSFSTKFDGTSGSYFTFTGKSSLALGTGDFTIESWVYRNTTTGAGGSADAWYTGTRSPSAGGGIGIKITNGGQIAWNTNTSYGVGTIIIPVYTWAHVAVTRVSGTLKWYINGVLDYSISMTNNYSNPVAAIGITDDPYYSTLTISNFRIVTGTAVYTSNFTPPTSPLTAIANTALLTCQDNILKDNSSVPATVTQYGTAQRHIAANPFGDTTTTDVSYTPVVNGGSLFFDGTVDRLTIANYPNLAFGANAFTIQCWFYTNAASTEQTIMTNGWASYAPWLIRLNTSNQILLNMSLNGGSWYVSEAVFGTVTTKQWYHVAVTRSSGGTLRAFLNGVQGYTTELGTSALYNGSQALNVGGRSDTSVPFNGYLSDAQLINGSSLYSANFAAPVVPTVSTSQTTLLLNGINGGIIDYHGTNDLETVGNTTLASEDPYAGSYYSNYFDNIDADGLTLQNNAGLQFGTGDFTLELWIFSNSDYTTDIVQIKDRTTAGSWALVYQNLVIKWQSRWGNTDVVTSGSNLITVSSWNHIAVVRISGTTKIYLNGVEVGSASDSTDYSPSTSFLLAIGGSSSPYYNNYWGYISNLRVVKGTGVYTTAFTPSTTPLTAISGTSLLTCQSNKFVDNSPTNSTITPYITPQVKSMNPFQQNTGKSLYFDGTGDYLKSYNVEPIRFGAGNFTIEFWMYPTVLNAAMVILSSAQTGVQGGNVDIRTDYIGATSTPIYFAGGAADYWATYNGPLIGLWTHIAFVRNGSTVTTYVNGVSIGTGAAGTQTSTAFQAINIGGGSGLPVSGYQGFQGYIKDLRITKGVARYTTTFTPPTSELEKK